VLLRKSEWESFLRIFYPKVRLLWLLHHQLSRLHIQQLMNWVHKPNQQQNVNIPNMLCNLSWRLKGNRRWIRERSERGIMIKWEIISSKELIFMFWSVCTFLDENDRHDHTIDTQDTSHDNWNQRFHDNRWLPYTNATDSWSSFGGAVSSTDV